MESTSSDGSKRHVYDLDLSQYSPKKAKTGQDVKRVEEDHFSELMGMVYGTVTRLKKVSKDNVDEALDKIKEAFKVFKFKKINLSYFEYSCAYIYKYGAHGAGLTRCRVLEALQKCQDLATKFEKPNLSVMSLGGGPGNDIIGLCSALEECNVQSSLNIKVMDSVGEWSLYLKISALFIKEGYFGNASAFFRRNVANLGFLQVKIPANQSQNKEYFRFLKESDVILMVKFLSGATYYGEDIVKGIYNDMKDDALILCIDSPFEEDWWTDFEVLYLSEPGEEHYYRPSKSDDGPEKSKARIAVLRKRLCDKNTVNSSNSKENVF